MARKHNILHRLPVVWLLLLMAAASAVAQNVVRQGETSQLRVEQMPGDTYTWDLYRDSTVNFAVAPGDCPPTDAYFPNGNTGATVDVTWLEPGIYFFRVLAVDAAGCTNNLEVGRMQVLEALPTATPSLDPNEICVKDPSVLTITLTGTPLWGFTLEATDEDGTNVKDYTDIDNAQNPVEIMVSPPKTTVYRVTKVWDKWGTQLSPSETVTLTVHPLPDLSPIYLKE